MEARRMRAVELFEEGSLNKAEIARQLGMAHETVSDWHDVCPRAATTRCGPQAGPNVCRSSTTPKLEQIEAELLKGAKAHGYPNELWTPRRVADVMERITKVAHHPNHLWRILRDKLGSYCQRPTRRAVERDGQGIEHGVKDAWPATKEGAAPLK